MTQNLSQVDRRLTDASLKYTPDNYISESILPKKTVTQNSGLLTEYGKGHLRIESASVGGRTKYPLVKPNVTNDLQYLLQKKGLSDIVTEEDKRNVMQPEDAIVDSVEDLTTRIWLIKEQELSAAIQSTSVITQNVTLAGNDQYSDRANSDPLGDFKTAINTVEESTGIMPNKAVMNSSVARCLRIHPDLVDFVKFTSNVLGGLSDAQLALALGVDEVLIGKVSFNDTKLGQADALARLWANDITFLVAPKVAKKKITSFGFHLQLNQPRRIFRDRITNPPRAEEIKIDDEYQFFITNTDAGYLIKNAVA